VSDLLIGVAIVAVWAVLQLVIMPILGVPT
jgi:hypothetical protein